MDDARSIGEGWQSGHPRCVRCRTNPGRSPDAPEQIFGDMVVAVVAHLVCGMMDAVKAPEQRPAMRGEGHAVEEEIIEDGVTEDRGRDAQRRGSKAVRRR